MAVEVRCCGSTAAHLQAVPQRREQRQQGQQRCSALTGAAAATGASSGHRGSSWAAHLQPVQQREAAEQALRRALGKAVRVLRDCLDHIIAHHRRYFMWPRVQQLQQARVRVRLGQERLGHEEVCGAGEGGVVDGDERRECWQLLLLAEREDEALPAVGVVAQQPRGPGRRLCTHTTLTELAKPVEMPRLCCETHTALKLTELGKTATVPCLCCKTQHRAVEHRCMPCLCCKTQHRAVEYRCMPDTRDEDSEECRAVEYYFYRWESTGKEGRVDKESEECRAVEYYFYRWESTGKEGRADKEGEEY